MKRTFLTFSALLFCALALHAQMTIENLLSVPFPVELKSSPDGKQLAWIFNDQGIRNVYIADAPDFTPRKLTNHTTDDGLQMANLAFTPDGRRLIFTEGNNLNGKGEAANPALLQQSTAENVWIVQTDGAGLRKLAKTDQVMVDPFGNTAVYASGGKIMQVSMSDTTKPVQLFEGRGNIGDLRWSPDGRKLAFISFRNDHAFLAIWDLAQKSITYPDPTIDIDQQPVWSPDGKWIAYVRTTNVKNQMPFVEQRQGNPWSIRLLNVQDLRSKEVFKADEGDGSVLFTEFPAAENIVLWAASNQLVFPWEKDGWQHLYTIDAINGGKPKLLTPGAGEVEQMVLSADRTALIYTTNIGDSHHRHIWKVAVSQGQPVQLSKGDGIEWSAVNLSNNGIAIIQSTATHPGWPAILQADGSVKKVATNLFPAAFPEKELIVPKLVSFNAKDGQLIYGQIFLPKGYQPAKKYPTLIFFHGGSRRQMLLGFHYMDYYSNDYAMNQYYASKGYIVLAVNYRSGIGYGLNFREALHYGANGASEYLDVQAAGLYLRGRADVDGKRIGLWGGSYGGFLTAMGLARNSDMFACGVDIHGVHDWSEEMKVWVADFDPALQTAFHTIALHSSPIFFADGWHSPVLFIHGDDDRNVQFSQTVNMAEQLRARKVYFEELIIPDEIHDFLLHKTWLTGYHAGFDFFERKLK